MITHLRLSYRLKLVDPELVDPDGDVVMQVAAAPAASIASPRGASAAVRKNKSISDMEVLEDCVKEMVSGLAAQVKAMRGTNARTRHGKRSGRLPLDTLLSTADVTRQAKEAEEKFDELEAAAKRGIAKTKETADRECKEAKDAVEAAKRAWEEAQRKTVDATGKHNELKNRYRLNISQNKALQRKTENRMRKAEASVKTITEKLAQLEPKIQEAKKKDKE